jgi:DNA-binding transcriptional MerR regulator
MDDPQKSASDHWLTPAECAKRTGLTVKALRVYERYGLLTAKRGQNGWRYYGLMELERLNTIIVLKSLGMTLAQIRDLVRAKEPSLERVLEIQVKAWRTKKSDVDRGLVLAEAALKRVQAHQPLSIDAICNLIRRLEPTDYSTLIEKALDLLNDELTPDEYATAMEFLKRNFDLSQVKAQMEGEIHIFKKLNLLMESGAAVDSEAVQRLLVEHNEIGLYVGNHERTLKMIEWNRSLGMKFFAIETRGLKKMLSQPEAEPDPRVVVTPKLFRFYFEANKCAPWAMPLASIIADTNELLVNTPDSRSQEAQHLVQRYRETYARHSLGDAEVEARLIPYREAIRDGWSEWAGEDAQAAWLFLSEAVMQSHSEKNTFRVLGA